MTIPALWNSEGQFSGNSAQKNRREHCKTLRWWCWFGGSQPPWWRWKFGGRNNTTSVYCDMATQLDNSNCWCKHTDGPNTDY